MKINNLGPAQLPVLPEREASVRPDKSLGHFASDLLKNQDGQSRERMTTLLTAIDNQGKKLGEVPTYSELRKYREVVRQFIGEENIEKHTEENKYYPIYPNIIL